MNKNNLNSQVSGTSNSLYSITSEPPDIRNWFSSYTYESPVLDSNEGFCISPQVSQGEGDDEGLYVEDSEEEKEENCGNLRRAKKANGLCVGEQISDEHLVAREPVVEARKHDVVFDVEVPAYPDSLSLPSEPPDIANWFSSYVYESPELDSADLDVSVLLKCNFGKTEKVEKRKEDHLKELKVTRDTDGSSSCMETTSNGYRSVRSLEAEKENSPPQKHVSEGSNFSSDNRLGPALSCDKSTEDSGSIPSYECAISPRTKPKNLTPVVHEVQQTNKGVSLTSLNAAFIETCEYNMEKKSKVAGYDSGWIQLNHKSKEPYPSSTKPDDRQYISTKNGIPSKKKKTSQRIIDENFPSKSESREGKSNKSINSTFTEDKKAGLLAREVLEDKTNVQKSYAQESTGKWRCPQKSKPDRGPPLKQLRLERWVHRV